MMDMGNVISDVISAFEAWEGDRCCPGDDWSDEHESRDMVIALLKAQEPRVMMLEEARKLRADDVVWLEDKDKPKVIPAIFRNRHLWPHSAVMVLNFMRGDGVKVTAGEDDYGVRWRCWTSRPDEKRRAEIPWN